MPNERFEPETILVAGGAGFLGVHLCKVLLDQGHRVICLDNFQTGSYEALRAYADNPLFEVIRHDIIDPLPLSLEPTQIYNLACAASPRHYQADPVHTIRTCVYGAFNLLELSLRHKARILQASTSEVYGDPKVHPQHERYHGNVNPVGLRSCYDEGKRCAEALFSDFGRAHHLPYKIARIFNTYGPGMADDDGRVVSNFMRQALAGKPLTIYGDGRQTRSLCYVDDMIEGLIRLMNSVDSFKGPVNLGNPHEVSILEVAELIRSLCKSTSPIVFRPLPADDPSRRQPDITNARHHLEWEPSITLDEGLKRTCDYFAHQTL